MKTHRHADPSYVAVGAPGRRRGHRPPARPAVLWAPATGDVPASRGIS